MVDRDREVLSGDVTFTDSEDVETFLDGGSNDAGFVQIMRGTRRPRPVARDWTPASRRFAADWRPDIIGGIRVWTGPDSYIEVNYFTSEAEAREGEKKEPPSELAAQAADFEKLMANVEYSDLRDPWLY